MLVLGGTMSTLTDDILALLANSKDFGETGQLFLEKKKLSMEKLIHDKDIESLKKMLEDDAKQIMLLKNTLKKTGEQITNLNNIKHYLS